MNYTYYRRYKPSRKQSGFKAFFLFVVAVIILIFAVRSCSSFVKSILADKNDEATLTLEKGSAQILEWGQSDWGQVSSTQVLLSGDTVKTAEDSLVTLTFAGGSSVSLDKNTEVKFEAVTPESADSIDSTAVQLKIYLISGRVLVDNVASALIALDLTVLTGSMDIVSPVHGGVFLAYNDDSQEYAYNLYGKTDANLMDRTKTDSELVIETIPLEVKKGILLSDEDRKKIADRTYISTISNFETPSNDDFLKRSLPEYLNAEFFGETTVTPEVVEEEPVTEDPASTASTEVAAEPVSGLTIEVTSPSLSTKIQKDAIAIEGVIKAGTAETVTVTWDGNGNPYTLKGFSSGDSNFRFVADSDYKNITQGTNVYTVIAHDAEGMESNEVTVTIEAEW